MPTALLLAEPEPETRGYLERHLRHDGFDVVGASGGGEALALVEQARPSLLLLGSALPDASAPELCSRIRAGEPGRSWNREVPVIVLGSGRADAVDRVRAFDRGCDDYVASPYVYDELLARIRAVLRRSEPRRADRVEAAGMVIDRATRRVTVGGEPVALAGKEYELLLKLASEPTRVFTRDELLRDVWGFRVPIRTRTLDSHASRLRRKLDGGAAGSYVLNVWGIGYRLVEE
ncbi:MAG: response regulator transcription factor [Actinobacteria bacterium]|nr:response regulator transcription factor [Actinomycetota bacterium]